MTDCCVTMPLFDPTTAERFDVFHAENPHVYDALVRFAREWIARTGRRDVSARLLFERVRWEIAIATVVDEAEFKLNNNYAPFYSRLMMAREPDLAGLFHLRRSAADQLFGRSA